MKNPSWMNKKMFLCRVFFGAEAAAPPRWQGNVPDKGHLQEHGSAKKYSKDNGALFFLPSHHIRDKAFTCQLGHGNL